MANYLAIIRSDLAEGWRNERYATNQRSLREPRPTDRGVQVHCVKRISLSRRWRAAHCVAGRDADAIYGRCLRWARGRAHSDDRSDYSHYRLALPLLRSFKCSTNRSCINRGPTTFRSNRARASCHCGGISPFPADLGASRSEGVKSARTPWSSDVLTTPVPLTLRFTDKVGG